MSEVELIEKIRAIDKATTALEEQLRDLRAKRKQLCFEYIEAEKRTEKMVA